MNKLLKIMLVIAVCAAMLMMFGCKNETAGNGNETQGVSDQGGHSENVGGDATTNPEGDPSDATTGENGGADVVTEPPIGIEDPTQSTQEDDFEIDFGDLTGN